jgi:hypothetical protein
MFEYSAASPLGRTVPVHRRIFSLVFSGAPPLLYISQRRIDNPTRYRAIIARSDPHTEIDLRLSVIVAEEVARNSHLMSGSIPSGVADPSHGQP